MWCDGLDAFEESIHRFMVSAAAETKYKNKQKTLGGIDIVFMLS